MAPPLHNSILEKRQREAAWGLPEQALQALYGNTGSPIPPFTVQLQGNQPSRKAQRTKVKTCPPLCKTIASLIRVSLVVKSVKSFFRGEGEGGCPRVYNVNVKSFFFFLNQKFNHMLYIAKNTNKKNASQWFFQ